MARQRSAARVRALVSIVLLSGTLAVLAPQPASASPAGQLVVVDVASADSKDFSASSLKTINVDGSKSFVKPVDLPVADAAPANAFGLSGSSNGNGSLALSANGTHLMLPGYHHVPGQTGVIDSGGAPVDAKDTTAAQIQRMVARVGADGSVDTSTILASPILSKSAPRGVASADGTSFYVSGNGGSDSPKAGVVKVGLGGSGKVPITTTAQTNTRQIQIAGGQMYATSDKSPLLGLGRFDGAGLPTSATAITQLTQITTKAASGTPPPSDSYVPDALLLLDATAAVAGIDTAYVVVDADSAIGFAGEIRKYTSDGLFWSLNGTKSGDYPFLTGRVSGGAVHLFASKGTASGNSVVAFDDTGAAGPASFGGETTLATAPVGHAFRGVAFAPTGWNPGTIDSAAPTASVADPKVGSTVDDAHNPGTILTLADEDTDPGHLTVTAHSSDAAVIPDSGIDIAGDGLERSVSFTPVGPGRATVGFTVTDDNANTGTAQVTYAASSAPASATGRYFYESSDLSSAIDVGDGHVIAASSEDNAIRLYRADRSGRPVATFDVSDASAGIGGTNADIESIARVNDVLYVLGSQGNNSSGDAKPARRILFTAAIAGTGAGTTLTYIGKYTGLWDELRTWDQAHGDRLGFAAGQAVGVPANDSNGFNIEGMEFAPGSTSTAYLAFRAPLVSHAGKPCAVIVPVENANALVLGAGGTSPQFGDPIYLDLGGRTIREIRRNAHDEYLISAQADSGSPQWRLYAWDGNPANQPIAVSDLPNPDGHRTGSWESVVAVPHTLSDGGPVTLVADSGDTTFHGDATTGAAESKGLRKSYVDEFAVDSFTPYPGAPANVQADAVEGGIHVTWDTVASATSYVVAVEKGGTPTTRTVEAPAHEATITGLSPGSAYAVSVRAVNASGTSGVSLGPDVTPEAPPFAPPTDLSSPSHTDSSVALAWSKVPGASGYRVSRRAGSGPAITQEVGDVASASVTNLSASTEYSFDIAAVKADGTTSPASEPLTVTTSSAPTDRPSNVRWTSRTATSLTLAWTKKAGSAKYRIRYAPPGSTTYTYLTVGNVASAKISGLTRGTESVIRVAAITSGGTRSPYSSPLTARTSNLRPPANLVKTARTATTITLTWTKAVDAEGYRVYHGIGSGPRTKVEVEGGDTETVKITKLKKGTTYTIDVASTEQDGTSRSSYSPRISVTTSK